MNHPMQMLNYNAWANQTLLGRIGRLPPAVLTEETSGSFPSIALALSHMYAIDRTWHMVVTGTGMREALQACMPLSAEALGTAGAYAERFAELAGQFGDWLGSQADPERAIALDNPYTFVRETRLSEIVLHMVNHGSYHRGGVTSMLRQLGHASTMTDYALYWYQSPAAAAAE